MCFLNIQLPELLEDGRGEEGSLAPQSPLKADTPLVSGQSAVRE